MLHSASSLLPDALRPSHQTPVKRNKSDPLDLGTAESDNCALPTLEDIEAEQLFYRFDSIVRVSQEEPLEGEQSGLLERKLNYDPVSPLKLEFESASSSMKKKQTTGAVEVAAIKLFEVQEESLPVQAEPVPSPSHEQEETPCTPVGQRPSMKGVEATPRKMHEWFQ